MVKFNIHKNFLFCFICWTESSSGPDLKTEKHNWMLFSIHLVLVLQKLDISLPIGSKTTWGGHHQVFLGLTTLKLSAIVSITQTQTLDFFNTWTIYLETMSVRGWKGTKGFKAALMGQMDLRHGNELTKTCVTMHPGFIVVCLEMVASISCIP